MEGKHLCTLMSVIVIIMLMPIIALTQTVNNLPAMQETWVRSLGREDPLKGMATCSSILGWRIPWSGEPGGLQSMELQTVGRD